MKITIGIADDHQLFLKSLAVLIDGFSGFEVIVEALNGEELLKKMDLLKTVPDILLIDVNMPVMDGPATLDAVAKKYPAAKTIALSMKDDDITIIRMLQVGCCAYLLKDIHPSELEKALMEVYRRGYYNADATNLNFRRLIIKASERQDFSLSANEKVFLRLACSDLTYKQIAGEMCLSERTIDGYREILFEKLCVKSRVGMALEAIRLGLVKL